MANLDAVERRSHVGIEKVEPSFGRSQILRIALDDVAFELFTSLKRDSDQLLVFGQGAVDRTKHELPVFQRWSWAERHPCSVIVLNDPTLYLGEIPLGWFQGTAERHYLPECVAIIRHLVERMGLRPSDVLFYGTSGGGFTSLMMAALLRGAAALVNNPQTDVTRYYPRHVNALLHAGFGGISVEEARLHHARRMNLIEFFRSVGTIPDFYYVQNTMDAYHMELHFIPFITAVNEMILERDSLRSNRVFTELYAADRKHTPLPREESLRAIDRARGLLLGGSGNSVESD